MLLKEQNVKSMKDSQYKNMASREGKSHRRKSQTLDLRVQEENRV